MKGKRKGSLCPAGHTGTSLLARLTRTAQVDEALKPKRSIIAFLKPLGDAAMA